MPNIHIPHLIQDALSTALCPTPACTAVSHLSCLSHHFIKEQPTNTGLVPRGGTCTSCKSYTLWGDVVRGCYRRSAGGSVPEDEEIPEDVQGELSSSEVEQRAILSPVSSTRKKLTKLKPEGAPPKAKKPRQRKAVATHHVSSEGELFDLDVSSTDEGSSTGLPIAKKQGKSRKVVLPEPQQVGSSGKESSPGPPLPKKRARPRKAPVPKVPEAGSSARKTPVKKTKLSNRTPTKFRVPLGHLQGSDESGEFFDFGALSEGTTSDDDGPSRGRAKDNRGAPAPLKVSSPKQGFTPRARLKPNSPQATRTTPSQMRRISPSRDFHHQAGTSRSPFKPFPQLEPLGSHQNFDDMSTDSDDILPAEDVLMRAMSSLSVSSPAPSPIPGRRRYDSMDVIEISD